MLTTTSTASRASVSVRMLAKRRRTHARTYAQRRDLGEQELQPIYGAQRSRTDKISTKSFPTWFTVVNLCQNQLLGSRGDVCGLDVYSPHRGIDVRHRFEEPTVLFVYMRTCERKEQRIERPTQPGCHLYG